MANHADAELTVNGSVAVLCESSYGTAQSDPADEHATRSADVQAAVDSSEQAAEIADDLSDVRDADDNSEASKALFSNRLTALRWVTALVAAVFVAVSGLAGWLVYGAYKEEKTSELRSMFLAAGRQGALNLTTISYTQADADVQRVLASSTGQFLDEFSKRAPAFIDVVKHAQAKTTGNITEAGIESFNENSARVLVAVSVNTSNLGVAEQQPRNWRMRIDVTKVGDSAKVSNVGFVP